MAHRFSARFRIGAPRADATSRRPQRRPARRRLLPDGHGGGGGRGSRRRMGWQRAGTQAAATAASAAHREGSSPGPAPRLISPRSAGARPTSGRGGGAGRNPGSGLVRSAGGATTRAGRGAPSRACGPRSGTRSGTISARRWRGGRRPGCGGRRHHRRAAPVGHRGSAWAALAVQRAQAPGPRLAWAPSGGRGNPPRSQRRGAEGAAGRGGLVGDGRALRATSGSQRRGGRGALAEAGGRRVGQRGGAPGFPPQGRRCPRVPRRGLREVAAGARPVSTPAARPRAPARLPARPGGAGRATAAGSGCRTGAVSARVLGAAEPAAVAAGSAPRWTGCAVATAGAAGATAARGRCSLRRAGDGWRGRRRQRPVGGFARPPQRLPRRGVGSGRRRGCRHGRGAGGTGLPASAPSFTVQSPQRKIAICCLRRRAKRRHAATCPRSAMLASERYGESLVFSQRLEDAARLVDGRFDRLLESLATRARRRA